jgi:hypothetical protein
MSAAFEDKKEGEEYLESAPHLTTLPHVPGPPKDSSAVLLKSSLDKLSAWQAIKVFRYSAMVCFAAAFCVVTDGQPILLYSVM